MNLKPAENSILEEATRGFLALQLPVVACANGHTEWTCPKSWYTFTASRSDKIAYVTRSRSEQGQIWACAPSYRSPAVAVWDDADFVVMHLGFDEETNGVCGDFRLLEKAISVWAEELWCCDDWKRPASCSYVNVAKWMWRRSALCRIGVERYWCMQICTMCRSGAVIGTGVWWSDPCSYNSSYTSNDRRSLTEPDQSPKAVQSPISCPRIHVFLSHSSFMYSNYNFDTNCIDLHTVKTQALVIPGLYVGWVLHVH